MISSGSQVEKVFFQLNNLTLDGLALGDKTADVVLCLHGWLDNTASFIPMMNEIKYSSLVNLKKKRFIGIDWPGHGLSSHRSHDAHYHFFDYVYDLVQLFELEHWQKVDIVAHSMGGMVASTFAAAFPEKVKSLTLIDVIGFISAKAEESSAQLRSGMLSRLKASPLKREEDSLEVKQSRYFSKETAIKARLNASDLNYSNAKLIVERSIIKNEQGYCWRSDARLRTSSPYRMTFAQAQQYFRDIKCPVQLLYGSEGLQSVAVGLEHFAPLLQNFTAIEIIGGHHVHMEQTKTLIQLLNDFI